jgi:hypothetical protein
MSAICHTPPVSKTYCPQRLSIGDVAVFYIRQSEQKPIKDIKFNGYFCCSSAFGHAGAKDE